MRTEVLNRYGPQKRCFKVYFSWLRRDDVATFLFPLVTGVKLEERCRGHGTGNMADVDKLRFLGMFHEMLTIGVIFQQFTHFN